MSVPDPAPLILTVALAPQDQDRFNRLRALHFPAERNYLNAHLTLFHHLPGDEIVANQAFLADVARAQAPFRIAAEGLRSLGRGVAFTLASKKLSLLRSDLAAEWSHALTNQDRQGFRPHITIQNKVDPAAARALLAKLSANFTPFTVGAIGLQLWRYRGGPWDQAGTFYFTARPEDPPEHRRQ